MIEADGARSFPAKYRSRGSGHLSKSTRVLAVYGLDAVGKSFREACFRPGLAAEILEKKITDPISAVDIARLALESRGGKKNVKETMRYQVILNKADTTRRRQFAQEICRELENAGLQM